MLFRLTMLISGTMLMPSGDVSAAQTAPAVPPSAAPSGGTAAHAVLWHVVPYHPQGGEDGWDSKVAITAFNRGDYDLAIAAFTYLLSVRPNFADVHFNLGLCFEAVKDHDRAIVEFSAVVKAKPKLVDGYVELGRSYLSKGDLGNARSNAATAIKLKPKDEDAAQLVADIAAASAPRN